MNVPPVFRAFIALAVASTYPTSARADRLQVSENHRFLVHEDGRPFFFLGDTAWELFHRLNREEADRYLEDRARKGFTVIQAVALAEEDGLNTPNAYGHRPLVEDDPTRPDVKDGPQNDYWDHVDYIIAKAESLGLYVGLLPTWGDKWNRMNGKGPEVFTPENAEGYGEWIGRRYQDKPIIWILGGDRPIENDRHRAIIEAMARGVRKGDGGTHLITLHPRGGRGSSESFHNAPWLDFNMRQNGHTAEFNPRYANTRADYDLQPPKPIIDAEPLYEDHPISFKASDFSYSTSADARRPLYWDLFTGACGHTYGNHAVWQFWSDRVPAKNNPLMPWPEAMAQPGAGQMQYARWLLESRPYLTRIPDDTIIVPSQVPTAVPGAGRYRFVATRDRDGGYAMIYVPCARKFSVRLDAIHGPTVKAWWYNPRNGAATAAGEFPKTGAREFLSPQPEEDLDWVLVLDDAAKGYPPPGHAAR